MGLLETPNLAVANPPLKTTVFKTSSPIKISASLRAFPYKATGRKGVGVCSSYEKGLTGSKMPHSPVNKRLLETTRFVHLEFQRHDDDHVDSSINSSRLESLRTRTSIF